MHQTKLGTIKLRISPTNAIVATALVTTTVYVTKGMLDAGATLVLPKLQARIDKLKTQNENDEK